MWALRSNRSQETLAFSGTTGLEQAFETPKSQRNSDETRREAMELKIA